MNSCVNLINSTQSGVSSEEITLLNCCDDLATMNAKLRSYHVTPGVLELTPSTHLRVINLASGVIRVSDVERRPSELVDIETPMLCIIPPRATVSLQIVSATDFDIICISERTLNNVSSDFAVVTNSLYEIDCRVAFGDELLFETIASMKDLIVSQSCISSFEMDYLSKLLACRIIARYSNVKHDIIIDNRRLSHSALEKIYAHIINNLHRRIAIHELGELVALGPAHFSRLFKKATGITVHQYVIGKRVERARTLLKETAIRIADIAHECGFSDQMHLTRAFRSSMGTSPAAFRKRVKESQFLVNDRNVS